MHSPIICFGQQPCGFFPKRFLVAKINTARDLQKALGGKIIFFYHDSDADYRETITLFQDRTTNQEARLNFTQENKLQKKHSPLFLKRIPKGWKEEIIKQLPRFVDQSVIDLFLSITATNTADFCLEMYNQLGLLAGIEVVRSSDPDFRNQACDIQGGFADVKYQEEIVRAKMEGGQLTLHEGGEVYTRLPKPDKLAKAQITPGADERFQWMQSVVHSTHYIFGEGEKDYLNFNAFVEVKFTQREAIKNPNLAWLPTDKH